jgi:hypothetical protein
MFSTLRTQGDKTAWLLFIFAAKTVLCFKMVAQSLVRILANREQKQGLRLGNKLATNILTSLARRSIFRLIAEGQERPDTPRSSTPPAATI